MYMFLSPLVVFLPVQAPKKTLKQPLVPLRSHPEQVLDANKFPSSSALNPPAEIPVMFDPSP